MSPEKQRIAIAEFCGWKRLDVPYYGPFPYWDNPDGVYVGGGSWLPIPDYLNDLNAIHEVEKLIMDESSIIYVDYLSRISCPWHATAAQRCEALLKTIGKWEE